MNYIEKSRIFTETSLISLDECVLSALELFSEKSVKNWDFSLFTKPLIAGSGNAIVTAQIIFSEFDAIYCDETDFDIALKKDIDGVIIVSASWEKHAPIFAKKAQQKWLKTMLLTCAERSSAEQIIGAENTIITPKNREPYTYNTSTYMGWVLSKTWEDPQEIMNYIFNTIDPILEMVDFAKYSWYLLVTPNNFSGINQLLRVKFIELFGRKIARDVLSYEHIKHAITVIPDEKELAISFWEWEFDFEWKKINFPLPENVDLASMMAIWYYIIWNIQNSYPQYFKENIWSYIKRVNESWFSKGISIIID